jgi:hypothetical protein
LNYTQVQNTGDLRHILILEDYTDLPECTIDLMPYWENLNYQFGDFSLDLTLHRLRMRAWGEYNKFRIKEGDEKICNATFAKYKFELGIHSKDFHLNDLSFYWLHSMDVEEEILLKLLPMKDKIFETIDGFYRTLRDYLTYDEVFNTRLWIMKYIQCKAKIPFDLYDEALLLESITGKTIDVTVCPVARYFAIRKHAKQKSKDEANKVKKVQKRSKVV